MNLVSKVEEFKAADKLLYMDVKSHICASCGVTCWGNIPDGKLIGAEAELKEAVQDKREVLSMLRELEPVAALEESREALAFAEQIAGGVEGEAKFEISLRYVRIENVKPEYAAEAAELAEQGKPILAKMDEELDRLTGRIEAAKEKAQDDPSKLEKVEELKKLREVAIVEERDTAEIDAQIIALQEELEAKQKAAALAAEEVEILTRHAEKVKARREAVADIVAHIEGMACALRSFLVADQCNKAALELAQKAGELEELKQKAAKAPGFLRTPENHKKRYSFGLPRLEGDISHINDRCERDTDHWYGSPEGVYIARVYGS